MHTDGVTVFSQWPLQHFFDYIFSFDSIVCNLQYPRECQGELWIIVRGDGLPCGGESWCQMSISFANHGHLARTLSYHWTVNVALKFVVRSPPLCCPRSGLTILLFCRVPLTVVWFPSGVHPDAVGFSAVGIALGCVGCRVSLHIGWQDWMSVCSCTLKYQGGMGTPEATCAMHKNWLTRFGHILRMSVPFVNRPFESEVHGTVNFTQFCCLLLVTWCYRVLLSCYLRPK